MYAPISLPEATAPLQVAAVALGQSPTNIVILSMRQVRIGYKKGPKAVAGDSAYTALLIRIKSGHEVVLLLQYQKYFKRPRWWSRAYPAVTGSVNENVLFWGRVTWQSH